MIKLLVKNVGLLFVTVSISWPPFTCFNFPEYDSDIRYLPLIKYILFGPNVNAASIFPWCPMNVVSVLIGPEIRFILLTPAVFL